MSHPQRACEPLEITFGEAARLTGGTVDARWSDRPIGCIESNSRALNEGATFLALRGERHDGHRFIGAALQHGAGGLIVEKSHTEPINGNLPVLRVPDTLRAYGDIAAARRRAWGGPVLAIGGSAGKTTTRRLVAAALACRYNVLEPPRNYNNLIGVPYTLMQLTPGHNVAVLELGMNQPGELRRLSEIAGPSAALLTCIDRAHIGMFESMRELAAAKLDLFRGCAEGTPLVVNAGDGRTIKGLDEFRERHPIVSFRVGRPAHGALSGDVRIARTQPIQPVGYRFELQVRGESIGPLELRLFGRHHLENVAAAAALLVAAGYDPGLLAEALPHFRTEILRGQVVEADGVTWILDCYNASPAGMQGALESLGDVPTDGRRVLVLADMLELGQETVERHQMLIKPIVRLARSGAVDLLALGPNFSRIARDLQTELEGAGGSARGFESRDEVIEALRRELRPGDQVLLKGSHAFGLEAVAEAIAPGILARAANS